MIRTLAFLFAMAPAGVGGFSLASVPRQSSLLKPAGAFIGAPSSSPLSVLYMSDLTFDDVNGKDAGSTKTATQLKAATLEVEGMPPARKFDIDAQEIIRTSLLVCISVALAYKLTMIDPGMARGWSVEEYAQRMVTDIWAAYTQVLTNHPIATKAVTSGTVYTIGDIIAQRSHGETMESLDRSRVLRSGLAGFIGHGPMSHFWYQISEHFFTDILHITQWWSFVPKVVVDQGFWGPIWNNSYILLIGLMKRDSANVIWGDVKRTTVPLVLSGLKLWPLAHCITYGLIPIENRLLWVDTVEILWVTILASQAAGDETPKSETVDVEALALVSEK